jgi:arylsulfatase A-like enzyme
VRRGRFRRRLILAGLACAGLLAPASCARSRADEPRTSVVLVSLDTCRADRLSCYGAERSNSPHLDALAAESVLFEDCIASSSLTAPGHMSLFTGQHVHRHGLRTNLDVVFPATTLAGELARQGWRTAAFTGHGSLQARQGHGVGFELFESWVGAEHPPYSRNLPEVLPRALAWLDGLGAGEPFFLFVHGYDPHCPYAPPEPWRERYAGWYTEGFVPDELCGPAEFRQRLEDGTLGAPQLRLLNDLYDAEIRAADEALGTLLAELRARGLLERSIVVFTSDHGEALGHHGWVGHGQMFEDMLHVPLLIRFPGGRWAQRREDECQTIDVLPTLLSALGLATPAGVQGLDLMPLVRGDVRRLPPGRFRVSRSGDAVSVRFGGRWKLTFREGPEGFLDPSFFNLQEDPGELHDLTETESGRLEAQRRLARYAEVREHQAADDERFRGRREEPLSGDEEAQEVLRALGYVGGE